jgi:hypothetical protein
MQGYLNRDLPAGRQVRADEVIILKLRYALIKRQAPCAEPGTAGCSDRGAGCYFEKRIPINGRNLPVYELRDF